MINFRYHVVSLVAVFMALAVGILLGAGPLKEPIEDTLANQVSVLRDDKDALRAQLEAATARGAGADATLRALQSQALAGLLTEQTVAVVTVGGDSAARLERLREALAAAGAELVAEVELKEDWASGADDARAEVAGQIAELLGWERGDALGSRAMIAAALAQALRGPEDAVDDGVGGVGGDDGVGGVGGVGGDDAVGGVGGEDSVGGVGDTGGPGDEGGSGDTGEGGEAPPSDQADPAPDLFGVLSGAGLVSGQIQAPAAAVVVLAGPYIEDPAEVDPEAVTTGRLEPFVGVVSALVGAGLQTVVCGPDQVETDLVHRLRADATISRSASTVAAPLPTAESITALWALAAAFEGVTGAYGMDGAEANLPPYHPAPRAGAPGADDQPGAEDGAEGAREPSAGATDAAASWSAGWSAGAAGRWRL